MAEVVTLISVVIPTFNRPHIVLRAVRSALNQTMKAIAVIVVVDGSDAATEQALEAIGDSRLIVRTLPHNRGAANARNAGVEEAGSKWIAFLDDDDEWHPP